jgi:hypothetical protein
LRNTLIISCHRIPKYFRRKKRKTYKIKDISLARLVRFGVIWLCEPFFFFLKIVTDFILEKNCGRSAATVWFDAENIVVVSLMCP